MKTRLCSRDGSRTTVEPLTLSNRILVLDPGLVTSEDAIEQVGVVVEAIEEFGGDFKAFSSIALREFVRHPDT